MPLKWKIFLGLNFILALPAIVLLVLLVLQFGNMTHRSEDYLYFGLVVFCLATVILNGFLNILMIQRFYPDKLIPVPMKRLSLAFLILNGIVATGLLLLCLYAASEEFSSANAGRDASGKIALAILILALVIQVAVLVMQAQLPRLINRNNQSNMQSLIDAIGQ
jgi:hypothetical protein